METTMLGYDWPQLHAALNDLPTALLLTAVLFELIAVVARRPGFRQVSFWTLIVGAVGGAAAVISGLQAEEHIEHGEAVHQVMETHEQLGLITLGVFGVLALWRILRERRMGSLERALALILSLGGAAVLFVTANYGGRLIFEHAAAIPSRVLQNELQQRTGEHEHSGEAGHTHPASDSMSASPLPAAQPAVDSTGTRPHTHAPGTPQHDH
ncbi:MAG TPA: DUF2231 domain-containing protein [Gemmatimonadales bacterium]|nr:DUF2231 domain-containing protein [Gemmatimonadales bacterium]